MLCSADSLLSQWQDVQCGVPWSSRDNAGWGFTQLKSSSSTFTAESESLWEKRWARLRQSRDCSTWRQAQTAQSYWVSATQAELDTRSSPRQQRGSWSCGQAWSLSDEAYLWGVWPWECCTFVEIQVCQTLLLRKNLTASFGSQWHLFIF